MDEKTLADGAFQVPKGECPDPLVKEGAELPASRTPAPLLLGQSPTPTTAAIATVVDGSKSSAARVPAKDHAEKTEVIRIADRYLLVKPIGEGGMGTVWLAEQTQPVKRQVALKLIRLERAESRMILARFDAERQAIARMDHPHIAKLLDAGATANGSPFFVMELVQGVPLTEFCDREKLGLRERLALFVHICGAVQHAHHKGIIHRDLKPSNILVESHEGKPSPKVIDFGLAKASAGTQLIDQTMMTRVGTVMGTPLYMAPEQATFDVIDIDTRADIYSLGVILYELLTGTTPLPRDLLNTMPLDELLRRIREEEAPLPSIRLSQTENLKEVAASRNLAPVPLARALKGELDWIALKALAKERDRRYESAVALGRDVERYLAQEPVSAGPPSSWYRFRKFAQRHRAQVFAASLVLLALVAGITGTTIGMVQANRAKEKADAETQKAKAKEAEANAHKVIAQTKEAEANAVTQFFANKVFGAGRPKGEEGGLGHDVTLRDAIKASLPALAKSFADQPLVEARLRGELGATFYFLGDYGLGAEQYQQGRALCERLFGSNDARTLVMIHGLANCYDHLGRDEDAYKLRDDLVAKYEQAFGSEDSRTINAMTNLVASLREMRRSEEAYELGKKALNIRKRSIDPNDSGSHFIMYNLALCLEDMNRLDEARDLMEKTAQARQRLFGRDHRLTLATFAELADIHVALHREDNAIKILQETVSSQTRLLGFDHPDTMRSINVLLSAYHKTGQLDRAEALTKELIEWRQAKATKTSAEKVATESQENSLHLSLYFVRLAAAQAWRGQMQDYRSTCQLALQTGGATRFAPVADRIAKTCSLASQDQATHTEALALARRAMDLGQTHQWKEWFPLGLGMAEFRAGHHEAAERVLAEAIAGAKGNEYIINTASFYRAMSLFRLGKTQQAAQLAREAAARMKPLPKDEANPYANNAESDDLILWLAYKEAKALVNFAEN